MAKTPFSFARIMSGCWRQLSALIAALSLIALFCVPGGQSVASTRTTAAGIATMDRRPRFSSAAQDVGVGGGGGAPVVVVTPPVLPDWEPTYNMSRSTVIMPCNWTGMVDPRVYKGYGLVDFDWNSAKAIWSTTRPMSCEETLVRQAQLVKQETPQAKVFVYRNLVKALPWYTSVREKITDPAYAGWFLPFKPGGSLPGGGWHSPNCSTDLSGEKCSALYHDQEQTPHPPRKPVPGPVADSTTNCATGVCDCGKNFPCGEYLWDHRNQSLRTWLIEEFVLGANGMGNAAIDGYYFDDSWKVAGGRHGTNKQCDSAPTGGATEENYYCAADMGLSAQDVADIQGNWSQTAAAAEQAVLSHKGFTWGASSLFTGTGARALDRHDPRTTCLQDMRMACSANNPWHGK